MTLFLVLNIHGTINSAAPVRKALEELKVSRKFTASVVPDDPATAGMLRLCKDYVAWSPIEAELLATLLKKRGMVSATRTLDGTALKDLGFKKHEDLAAKMVKDQMRMSAVKGLKPFFRLSPPKGGFNRSTRRQHAERGTLGSNPELPEIVRRMM